MIKANKIVINKNRGWRGLAEVRLYNEEHKEIQKMIFSFSQPMWDDMLRGFMVIPTDDEYMIVEFDNLATLPRPDQQRSVLIKNFIGNVLRVNTFSKSDWRRDVSADDYNKINHFIRNSNNHTQSDWNCIGIRVIPRI